RWHWSPPGLDDDQAAGARRGARRRRGTPGRSTLVEGGRGSPTRRRSSRVVALVGCATSRAAGARRGRWGYSSTRVVALVGCRGGLMEIVDIVNNFPGQAHRWLVDEGGRGSPRWLDVDQAAGARRAARRRRGSLSSSGLDVDEGGGSSARRRRGNAGALVEGGGARRGQ